LLGLQANTTTSGCNSLSTINLAYLLLRLPYYLSTGENSGVNFLDDKKRNFSIETGKI
jgi:hypothetical protein